MLEDLNLDLEEPEVVELNVVELNVVELNVEVDVVELKTTEGECATMDGPQPIAAASQK